MRRRNPQQQNKAPPALTLNEALRSGRLDDFAKQESSRKGNRAAFKRLLGRAANAPRSPKKAG